ncbi:ATPase [Clostridium pasteurianum DSM 525 = ATCC 6013]|uniref:ATPase n=2 Tax=Clostridium pasteurianum TaxID=1501 RepID=A0A0H3J7V4_CLOPA|nr:AAA family ATPase [Clostridium pasteurianum]AJA47085.1 ATPase [Clostridium pasteurianum DSM 525 = ATCC 6013]AJA51073.1 ATPase [Clostridium pasteurianum DSM 525 = ATCC 6013]AOZ74448.1 ATPase [Clostridium pasteurianum DSM 525 = ATCC 6013]AOZ78245.1 ATPase [Clostridium pasteurianum]ELP59527.1 ATPase [Clostridium pasteurianum DSM 525 = ATCC 6013]
MGDKIIDLKRDAYEKLLEWKNNHNNKVLLIEGARQVGKTYLVKKFSRENYKYVIYINLLEEAGEDLLTIYNVIKQERLSGKLDREKTNSLKEMFKRFSNNFRDSEECIIIIDEIQESYKIYNMIRQFARKFKTHFIMTGSYLGRVVMQKEFWSPMGDVDFFEIKPLSFTEFMEALNLTHLYKALDLYGNSDKKDYQLIYDKYKDYLEVGGYPEIVCEYLTNHKKNINDLFEKLLRIFCEESSRYFDGDILTTRVFEDCISAIIEILARSKKGVKESSYTEELQQIITKKYSSNITKENCNRVLQWFYTSKFVKDCDKLIDFDFTNIKKRQRYFLSDVGMANFVMEKTNILMSESNGLLSETFVYNCLLDKIPTIPMFGVYGDGELDFIYRNRENGQIYGIEVKSGKNPGKTIVKSLANGKIDFAVYLKGLTQGGIANKTYTIPIFLFPRFKFTF